MILAVVDSNHRPLGYEPSALVHCANGQPSTSVDDRVFANIALCFPRVVSIHRPCGYEPHTLATAPLGSLWVATLVPASSTKRAFSPCTIVGLSNPTSKSAKPQFGWHHPSRALAPAEPSVSLRSSAASLGIVPPADKIPLIAIQTVWPEEITRNCRITAL